MIQRLLQHHVEARPALQLVWGADREALHIAAAWARIVARWVARCADIGAAALIRMQHAYMRAAERGDAPEDNGTAKMRHDVCRDGKSATN